MRRPGTRTCVDGVREADRVAAELRILLERDTDQQQRQRIEEFLHFVSTLGGEVGDEGLTKAGRAHLRDLQREFASLLTRERVVPPPLLPYAAERLRPITEQEIRNGLRVRGTEIIGRRYDERAGSTPFQQSDLERAVIIDCRFVDVDFSGVRFSDSTQLVRSRFINCTFDGAVAQGLRGAALFFRDCSFNDADFTGATFAYTVFEAGEQGRTRSTGVRLESASLTQSKIMQLELPDVNMTAANFTESNLDGSIFFNAQADASVFCETTMTGCDFKRAQLQKSYFRNCDLRDATFGEQPEDAADLTGANLRSVFNLGSVRFAQQHRYEAILPRTDPEMDLTVSPGGSSASSGSARA